MIVCRDQILATTAGILNTQRACNQNVASTPCGISFIVPCIVLQVHLVSENKLWCKSGHMSKIQEYFEPKNLVERCRGDKHTTTPLRSIRGRALFSRWSASSAFERRYIFNVQQWVLYCVCIGGVTYDTRLVNQMVHQCDLRASLPVLFHCRLKLPCSSDLKSVTTLCSGPQSKSVIAVHKTVHN